jgi:hypothetical protein
MAKMNSGKGKAAKAATPKKAAPAPAAKAKAPAAKPAKAAAPKKAAPAAKPAAKKVAPPRDLTKPLSRGAIVAALAEATDLKRPQVRAFFDALIALASDELKKDGHHVFAIPGLVKLTARFQPAQPAREGLHPIRKEKVLFKAKDATWKVRARPLKLVKEVVAK